jgi:hypothetical protein
LFGVPPDEQLSPYEYEVVRTIREKLADAWQLLYHLKYVLAARQAAGHEKRDMHTLTALYEHEFFNSLHNIFFFSESDIQKWKCFLDDLAEQMASLSEKYELAGPITAGFRRVTESFPPLEDGSFLDRDGISNLVFGKMMTDSENLALVVTQSFMQSAEFSGKIENWIYGWTKFIRQGKKNQCNKFQELVNLIWWTERGLMQKCHRLEREEEARLRHWHFLIERYGQEDVTLFLDLVAELNQKELKLFDKRELDSFSPRIWIHQKLEEKLKAKGLLEEYMNEVF